MAGFGCPPRTQSDCVEWVTTNIPMRPDTPYKWLSMNGDQEFANTILSQCTSAQECRAQRQRSFAPIQNPLRLRSKLGWGMNGDAHNATPDAYQEQPGVFSSTNFQKDLHSGISGTFVVPGLEGPASRVALDIDVTSSYKPGMFTYTVMLKAGPEQVRVVASKSSLKGFTLLWGAAAVSSGFALQLLKEPRSLSPSKSITIQVPGVQPELVPNFPLELYFNATRILSSRAPAYRPRVGT